MICVFTENVVLTSAFPWSWLQIHKTNDIFLSFYLTDFSYVWYLTSASVLSIIFLHFTLLYVISSWIVHIVCSIWYTLNYISDIYSIREIKSLVIKIISTTLHLYIYNTIAYREGYAKMKYLQKMPLLPFVKCSHLSVNCQSPMLCRSYCRKTYLNRLSNNYNSLLFRQ